MQHHDMFALTIGAILMGLGLWAPVGEPLAVFSLGCGLAFVPMLKFYIAIIRELAE